jgi:hypothetical protein
MKVLNLLRLAGILLLIQSTTSTALAQAAGNWNGGADFGSMTLSQSGSTVTGSFEYSNGRMYGTMSGSTLTGVWVQDTSRYRCNKAAQDGRYYWGKISFNFSANGYSGAWGYCDAAPGSKTQGTRVGAAPSAPVPASNAPAAPTGNNLALHKPARMSSQLGPGYEASLCVDGIGQGLCHTGREANPWWQVDLGRVYALGEIDVYNRTTVCCWERERSLVALISSDGGSWQQIYNNNGKDFQVLQIPANGYSARFVRLQLHATDWMNLAQVAVYGAGDTGQAVPVSQAASSTGALTPGDLWVGTDFCCGQRWDFTWRVRADGASFDTLSGGKVVATNCCQLLSIHGNSMTISHPQGTYHMTISADRLHVTGSFDWASGSSLVRTIQGHPLPMQYPAQSSASTGNIPMVSTPKTNQPTLPLGGSSGSQPPSAPMPANATRLSHPTVLPTVGNRRNVTFTDWVVLNADGEVVSGITTGDTFNTIGDYGGVPFTGLINYDRSGLVQMGVLSEDYGGFGVVGTHQQITLKGGTKAFFTPGAGPGKGGVMQGVLARDNTFNLATTGYASTISAGYFVSFDESGRLLNARPARPTD